MHVSVHLESYADFEDEEKVAKALEKLYLRALQYNNTVGYKSDPRWKVCARVEYSEKA